MSKSRKGYVFYNDTLAGEITETAQGYIFKYDETFLNKDTPISITLPIRKEPYLSKDLFSFFKGLLPEGWYLDIVTATQKINRDDLFGLLLCTTNKDTIGAVTIKEIP